MVFPTASSPLQIALGVIFLGRVHMRACRMLSEREDLFLSFGNWVQQPTSHSAWQERHGEVAHGEGVGRMGVVAERSSLSEGILLAA